MSRYATQLGLEERIEKELREYTDIIYKENPYARNLT